jgi:hypothetical protein
MNSALVGGEWSASLPSRFTPRGRAPGTHCIGGWLGPRAGLDDVEKRKFLTLPGHELRPLGRPARRQSLYRLRYLGFSSLQIFSFRSSVRWLLFWTLLQTTPEEKIRRINIGWTCWPNTTADNSLLEHIGQSLHRHTCNGALAESCRNQP